ncbi:hypothetical protein Trydic_g18145 [Trypoxylus dichotomus]
MASCIGSLEKKQLWNRFHELETEMIITKTGRRMFPDVSLQVYHLDPHEYYCVMLEMVPIGNCRYKYSANSGWTPAGAQEAQSHLRAYLHPDSPATGEHWMSKAISFSRMKLTNTSSPPPGHIVLTSMHKYQPMIVIIMSPDARRVSCVPSITLSFPETQFIAVTAYQNEMITSLKIEHNPFAKGFRANGHSKSKRKRIQMEEEKRILEEKECKGSKRKSPGTDTSEGLPSRSSSPEVQRQEASALDPIRRPRGSSMTMPSSRLPTHYCLPTYFPMQKDEERNRLNRMLPARQVLSERLFLQSVTPEIQHQASSVVGPSSIIRNFRDYPSSLPMKEKEERNRESPEIEASNERLSPPEVQRQEPSAMYPIRSPKASSVVVSSPQFSSADSPSSQENEERMKIKPESPSAEVSNERISSRTPPSEQRQEVQPQKAFAVYQTQLPRISSVVEPSPMLPSIDLSSSRLPVQEEENRKGLKQDSPSTEVLTERLSSEFTTPEVRHQETLASHPIHRPLVTPLPIISHPSSIYYPMYNYNPYYFNVGYNLPYLQPVNIFTPNTHMVTDPHAIIPKFTDFSIDTILKR